MRMTASWSRPSERPTEYKVVRRGSPPLTAGSPPIGRASPGDCVRCREPAERGPHGPDPDQRDTVLDAVKDKPLRGGPRGPSLTASARGVTGAAHGRDEETALRSNKETGPEEKGSGSHGLNTRSAAKRCLTKSPIQGWAKGPRRRHRAPRMFRRAHHWRCWWGTAEQTPRSN